MKIIIPFIIAFIFISCNSNQESSENQNKIDKLESKIELLEKQLEVFNDKIHYIDEFKYCVKNIEILVYNWVENQSKADSQKKIELIQQEDNIKELLRKILNSGEIDKSESLISNISKNLDALLQLINQIKITLPSFESYENLTNQFLMQILIEPDGELDLTVRILLLNIENYKKRCLKAKKIILFDIDKLKLEIKKISSE